MPRGVGEASLLHEVAFPWTDRTRFLNPPDGTPPRSGGVRRPLGARLAETWRRVELGNPHQVVRSRGVRVTTPAVLKCPIAPPLTAKKPRLARRSGRGSDRQHWTYAFEF